MTARWRRRRRRLLQLLPLLPLLLLLLLLVLLLLLLLQGQEERRGWRERERREERRGPPQQFRSDGLHDGGGRGGSGRGQPAADAVFVQVTGHGVVVVRVQAQVVFDVGPKRWRPAVVQRQPATRRRLLLKMLQARGLTVLLLMMRERLLLLVVRQLLVVLVVVAVGVVVVVVVVVLVMVLLLLFLEQAMDLEPVGPPAVPGPALGHAHHQTLAQPARLARRSVLLVDHAFSVVLAFRYRAQVVVGPTEKRLKQ